MATQKSTESIITLPFRLAFPEVFTAKKATVDSKEKYSINMLFPKDGSPLLPIMAGNAVLELRKLAFTAIKLMWGEDKTKWPAQFRVMDFANYVSPNGKDGWPFRHGDEVDWEGYDGTIFVRAASQFKPGVVDSKLQAVISPSDIFGGLICRAQVNAFGYDQQGNKGVAFGLSNLQVLKDDGTVYSGRQNPADVFGAFGDPDAGSAPAGNAAADPFFN